MDRIVELGRKVWSLLTEDERERYYTVGTLTFVEDIATIIGHDLDSDDTSIDDIHDKIFTDSLEKEILRLTLELENRKNPGLFDTDRNIDEIIEENPGILDQIVTDEGDKIMTNTEKLEQLADKLRPNVDNRLDLAILTLVETFAEVGDSQITSSCGDIGISLTEDSLFLVDIDTGEIVFGLRAEIE